MLKYLVPVKGKRKKRKPNDEQRALASDWQKLIAQHSFPLEKGMNGRDAPNLRVHNAPLMRLENPPGREKQKPIPSRVTPGSATTVSAPQRYTGTAMLGIGQMHKSNAVPVFQADDAIDIARMRRG